MTKEQFGKAIQECFLEVYGKCFVGNIVISREPYGIDVGLAFMSDINKVHIAAPLDDEDFIEFFKKELKRRRFDANKYSYIKRVSEICPEKN